MMKDKTFELSDLYIRNMMIIEECFAEQRAVSFHIKHEKNSI